MQMGVHPVAVPLALVLLDALMRPVPIAATRPPERLQGGTDVLEDAFVTIIGTDQGLER